MCRMLRKQRVCTISMVGGESPLPTVPFGFPNFPWEPYSFESTGNYKILDYDLIQNGRSIQWGPDGYDFYIAGRSISGMVEGSPSSRRGGLLQYRASKPYDITSITLVHKINLMDFGDFASTQNGSSSAVHGLVIGDEGNKLFIVNRWEIWEFPLTTPWDISSIQEGYFRETYQDMATVLDPDDPTSPELETPYAHDCFFSPDGTVVYIDQRPVHLVHQYSMSTPWDISTMVYDGFLDIKPTVKQYHMQIRGIGIDPSGRRLYVLNNYFRFPYFNVYHLNTAWDVSTGVFQYEMFIPDLVGKYPNAPYGPIVDLTWQPDGFGFWIVNMAETGEPEGLRTGEVAVIHYSLKDVLSI